MNKIRKKICMLLSVALLFWGDINNVASADTVSAWTTKTVNERAYKFDSEVWNRSKCVQAVAQVKTSDSMNAKAGYMGAQARLYTASDKHLRKSSSLTYTDRDCVNIYVYSPEATTTDTYFYSQSKVQLYNGNGYTTYTADQSPNCKVKGSAVKEINKNNEKLGTTIFKGSDEVLSYGLGLQVDEDGEEPDLICAVGINNISGYVKADDLCPNVSSPSEACTITQELAEGYTIPVYDLEGNIVDQFAVGK